METFIEEIDNHFNKEFCSQVVASFEILINEGYFVVTNGSDYGKLNRDDISVFLPDRSTKEKGIDTRNLHGFLPDNWIKDYSFLLVDAVNHYIKKYGLNDVKLFLQQTKFHQVLKGQGYHQFHFENCYQENSNRVIVFMTYLEIPKEGGETEFLYQNKRIVPKVGTTVIWPAGFTHMHRGNPVLEGRKSYLTGWFAY